MHSLPKSFDLDLPPRPLRQRVWFRVVASLAMILAFGAVRLPIEVRLNQEYRDSFFHGAKLNLGLRQQIGQAGFLAALGGFRALVADGLWIQLHMDWQRTEWGKMLFLINNVTALQPRNLMFWEMSAWHMAYNASAFALDDPSQPREALRLKHQHEYFLIGKDILERGIANNPDRYNLYEALGNVLRDKLKDHYGAYQNYAKAATFPDCMTYENRFALYELASAGHEREAYEGMLALYNKGDQERLPTLCSWLKYLQEELNIPAAQRVNIPDIMLPRARERAAQAAQQAAAAHSTPPPAPLEGPGHDGPENGGNPFPMQMDARQPASNEGPADRGNPPH